MVVIAVLVTYLSLTTAETVDEDETCFDGPFDNVGVEGCLGECEDYDTLEEAQSLCLSNLECSGVTLAVYGDREAIDAGVGLYELRQGPGLIKSHGDKTWIKQAWCKDALNGESGQITVPLGNVTAGTYTLHAITNNGVYVKKLIVFKQAYLFF